MFKDIADWTKKFFLSILFTASQQIVKLLHADGCFLGGKLR